MLARFINTNGWGSQEWLAAVLLAFIFVTMGVVLWRMVGLFSLSRRKRLAPNLRPLRRPRAAKHEKNTEQSRWILGTALSVLSVSLGALPSQASAIITRHDVADSAYQINASDFPAVFFLEKQGSRKVCAATLIHAQWAITAAHCLEQTSLKSTLASEAKFSVKLANESRAIDAFVVHPLYDLTSSTDVDLALLHFEEPLAFPRPILLADGEVAVGQIVRVTGTVSEFEGETQLIPISVEIIWRI